MKVKIRRVSRGSEPLPLPEYKTLGAGGVDLSADVTELLVSGDWFCFPTGIAVEIPPGYEGQIRPRSGLASVCGITVLNSPGTIDSDYRGEIGVILVNHGSKDIVVERGQRIAQLVIAPVVQAEFVEEELSETDRGAGGFGSTGK